MIIHTGINSRGHGLLGPGDPPHPHFFQKAKSREQASRPAFIRPPVVEPGSPAATITPYGDSVRPSSRRGAAGGRDSRGRPRSTGSATTSPSSASSSPAPSVCASCAAATASPPTPPSLSRLGRAAGRRSAGPTGTAPARRTSSSMPTAPLPARPRSATTASRRSTRPSRASAPISWRPRRSSSTASGSSCRSADHPPGPGDPDRPLPDPVRSSGHHQRGTRLRRHDHLRGDPGRCPQGDHRGDPWVGRHPSPGGVAPAATAPSARELSDATPGQRDEVADLRLGLDGTGQAQTLLSSPPRRPARRRIPRSPTLDGRRP